MIYEPFLTKEAGFQHVHNELVCKLLRQDYTHSRGLCDLEIGQRSDWFVHHVSEMGLVN